MPELELTGEQLKDHQQRLQDAGDGVHFDTSNINFLRREAIIVKLLTGEMELASPGFRLADYDDGVAYSENQSWTRFGLDTTVISTEHATKHWRTRRDSHERVAKEPESGTAGLGNAMVIDRLATHTTLLGRQTGDANYDDSHPFKQSTVDLVQKLQPANYISLHGMLEGHVTDLSDDRSYDVAVGVGDNPTAETQALAELLIGAAAAQGLKAGINPAFIKIKEHEGNFSVVTTDEGELETIAFAAHKPQTMRSTIEAAAAEANLRTACIQLELARTLRLVTAPVRAQRSEKINMFGPYIGHAFLTQALTFEQAA